METMTTYTRRIDRNGRELRFLIDTILTFPVNSRMYWINALVRQGRIDKGTAGRILVSVTGN